MAAVIRLATADDAEGVQEIYAPIVRDTVISFGVDPPSIAEMRQRILDTLDKLGGWHDVGWWQLTLQPHVPAPAAPRPLSAVQGSRDWQEELAVGTSLLRR